MVDFNLARSASIGDLDLVYLENFNFNYKLMVFFLILNIK